MMSNQPTIPLGLNIANPTLRDVLTDLKQEIMLAINCHGIATIRAVSKNEDNGLITVNATMNYCKTIFVQLPDGTFAPQLKNYPVMLDCPVIVLGGGSTALSFPISVGDQCLILFNDRDLNNWFAGAMSGPVASPRLHSFADAIALVGFQRLASLDTTHAYLTNGNAQVGVEASKDGSLVKIANDTTTLNTLLQDLVNNVKDLVTATAAITVTCASPGSPSSVPINVAAINAVATELTTTASKLGGLLE